MKSGIQCDKESSSPPLIKPLYQDILFHLQKTNAEGDHLEHQTPPSHLNWMWPASHVRYQIVSDRQYLEAVQASMSGSTQTRSEMS